MLSQIVVWCLGIALFLLLSEVVTELYPSTEESFQLKYALFGMFGLTKLVPWSWASFVMMIGSFVLLLIPRVRNNYTILPIICVSLFIGIWIDKGYVLTVAGMIPSPLGEFSEYTPTWIEIFIVAGNWAIGFIIFTILAKGTVGVMLGDVIHPSAAGKEVVHH